MEAFAIKVNIFIKEISYRNSSSNERGLTGQHFNRCNSIFFNENFS